MHELYSTYQSQSEILRRTHATLTVLTCQNRRTGRAKQVNDGTVRGECTLHNDTKHDMDNGQQTFDIVRP